MVLLSHLLWKTDQGLNLPAFHLTTLRLPEWRTLRRLQGLWATQWRPFTHRPLCKLFQNNHSEDAFPQSENWAIVVLLRATKAPSFPVDGFVSHFLQAFSKPSPEVLAIRAVCVAPGGQLRGQEQTSFCLICFFVVVVAQQSAKHRDNATAFFCVLFYLMNITFAQTIVTAIADLCNRTGETKSSRCLSAWGWFTVCTKGVWTRFRWVFRFRLWYW